MNPIIFINHKDKTKYYFKTHLLQCEYPRKRHDHGTDLGIEVINI